MKLKINILIILIFIGFNSYSQNVTGSVYASVFDYTMINESSHEFSFTTYFSMGGGKEKSGICRCPATEEMYAG